MSVIIQIKKIIQYKIPTIPNKNVIITQSNKIHKKNNSGQFHENSLKKLIIHDKNHSVLTETMKVRFEMFYIQGMRVIEIAGTQGVDEKAVRKSLERIKAKLIKVFYELWNQNNS